MNDTLAARLRFCTTLPTPPSTALRIIELANDPDINLTQLADCIAVDPALSAKLLKVANSPLYTTHRVASNLRQAVNMMGTHATATVALSFSLVKGVGRQGDDMRFWRRAVLSALACRLLGQRFGFNPDDLLLAGLLQDIGILALRSVAPDEYAELQAITEHEELLQAERNRFGSGHDEVGYWLLTRWGLPDHLSLACIAHQTALVGNEAQATPLACVATSGYLADVFLKDDHLTPIVTATESAARWLGMDSCTTIATLEKMREQMQEFEGCFDVHALRADQEDALLHEARELITIANLGRQRELEQKTQRDMLTGAHNRQYFDEAFKHEFAVASRHGWPLSVAFIDIDHFKQVNDTHGHAAGDNALVTLSRTIASQIRGGDVFARYGGEEFVLLFPGTTAEAARIVLSRIRQAIASCSHTYDTATFHLTISAGLAFHMDGDMKHETAEDMLAAADSALYMAKHNGRNQIIKSGET